MKTEIETGLQKLNEVVWNYNDLTNDCPDTFLPFSIDIVFSLMANKTISTFIETEYQKAREANQDPKEAIPLIRLKQFTITDYAPTETLFELRTDLISMDEKNLLHLYKYDLDKEIFEIAKSE